MHHKFIIVNLYMVTYDLNILEIFHNINVGNIDNLENV